MASSKNNGGRLNIVVSRTGNDGKRFYTTIGAAFPIASKPGSYSLKFDALPINGECALFPATGKEERDAEKTFFGEGGRG